QSLQDQYTIPPKTVSAARAALRRVLGSEAELITPSERGNGYIPVGERLLPNAPGDSGWHGEGRGIQAAAKYGSPATRQWSSLGRPSSIGARGAACADCETL